MGFWCFRLGIEVQSLGEAQIYVRFILYGIPDAYKDLWLDLHGALACRLPLHGIGAWRFLLLTRRFPFPRIPIRHFLIPRN